MAKRAAPRAFVCLLIALAIVPAAAAEPTRKKSIWGPIEHNGVSQFPIYRELGVGIIQTAVAWSSVAPTRPQNPTDPADPAYLWPAEIDVAVAEGARHGISVSILLNGAPGWANRPTASSGCARTWCAAAVARGQAHQG